MAQPLSHFADTESIGAGQQRAQILAYPKYYHQDPFDAQSPFLLADPTFRRNAANDGWVMDRAVHRMEVFDDGRIAYEHFGYRRTLRPIRRILKDTAGHLTETPLTRPQKPTSISDREVLLPELMPGLDMRVAVWHDGLRFQLEAGLTATMRDAAEVHYEFDDIEEGKFNGRLDAGAVRHEQAGYGLPEIRKKTSGKYTVGFAVGAAKGWPDGTITLNDSVSYQEGTAGYSGCEDNFFYKDDPDYNFGAHDRLQIGVYDASGDHIWRSLVKFDLSAIGACSAVASATLSLYLEDYKEGTSPMGISTARIVRDWGEGDNTGQNADAGESSWDAAKEGTDDWATAGCDNTTTDRTAVANSLSVDDTEEFKVWNIQDWAEDWLVDADPNYGLILISDTEGAADRTWYRSGAWETTAERPKIDITYTLVSGTVIPVFMSSYRRRRN